MNFNLNVDVARLSATLNEKYASAMSNFVFRRIRDVNALVEDLNETRYYWYDDGVTNEYEPIHPDRFATLSEKEIEQYVEFRYRKFTATTTSHMVREDQYDGEAFFLHSNNLGIFNPITLEWSRDRATIRSASIVAPRKGDLICGVVDTDSPFPPKRGTPYRSLKYWFICSEQFLRFWTAVMFEDHESFDMKFKVNPLHSLEEQHMARLERIRGWLMSGSRLCTNSFRKWVLSEGSNREDKSEVARRLYRLRTESWSHMNVHIYAALVLLIRYGELPTDNNVPQNIDGPNGVPQPKMKHWDLPVGFMNAVIARASYVA